MKANKKYFKWFIGWYKDQIKNDIKGEPSAVIMIMSPNELYPEYLERDEETFLIECFEGKSMKTDKLNVLLEEMCIKADDMGIRFYASKNIDRKNPKPHFDKQGFVDFNETYLLRTPKI